MKKRKYCEIIIKNIPINWTDINLNKKSIGIVLKSKGLIFQNLKERLIIKEKK